MIKKKDKYLLACIIVICLILNTIYILSYRNYSITNQKKEAKSIASTYSDLIQTQLKNVFNYTDSIELLLQKDYYQNVINSSTYQTIKESKGILDIVIKTRDEISNNSANFSNKSSDSYPFRLAALKQELVIHGPIKYEQHDKNIITTILPVYIDNTLQYCIAIYLDFDLISESFQLDNLKNNLGYNYQLWYISAETGHKSIISTSNTNTDFLNAIEVKFEMPAQWGLEIIPENSWGISIFPIVIETNIVLFIFVSLIYMLILWQNKKNELDRLAIIDNTTQFLNFEGFIKHIDYLSKKNIEVTVCLIEINNAHKIYNMLDLNQRDIWLKSIVTTLQKYAKNKNTIARIQESMFAIIFNDYIENDQLIDIEREIEIDVIQSIIIDNQRITLQPFIESFYFPNQNLSIQDSLVKAQKQLWQKI